MTYFAIVEADDLLCTDRIQLRPPRAEDVEVAARLEVDPEVRRYVGGPTRRRWPRSGPADETPWAASLA